MNYETKCKFCGKFLNLDIDDDYAKTHDRLGIIQLAACNRCADLRERRRSLHEQFLAACATVICSKDSESLDKARASFERLTKKYLMLISDWTGQQLCWEEEMIRPFMAAPKALGAHLRFLWTMARQPRLIE